MEEEYKIVCGACGSESDSLFCHNCWEVMLYWSKQKEMPTIRCNVCNYPEALWEVKGSKFCPGCKIRRDVKILQVPKKRKKRARQVVGIPATYTNGDTSAATGLYYPPTASATSDSVRYYMTDGSASAAASA